MSDTPLHVRNVSWGFSPDKPLGAGLNVTLDAGDCLVIVGPNAAGKSALISTICGTLSPLSGQITLSGHDITTLPSMARAQQVAVLLQQPDLDVGLTVSELVSLGRTAHLQLWGRMSARDEEAVATAITMCDLEHIQHRSLRELSGGERQRAQLAMAVAQGAPLLILDEPSTHLDLRRRHQLFAVIAQLRAETSVAVLMVLHEINDAIREADRMLIIADGRATQKQTNDPHIKQTLATAFQVPIDRIG